MNLADLKYSGTLVIHREMVEVGGKMWLVSFIRKWLKSLGKCRLYHFLDNDISEGNECGRLEDVASSIFCTIIFRQIMVDRLEKVSNLISS